jgi:hypothetical protein
MNARRRRWSALGTVIILGGVLLTSSCQRIGSINSIELISDEDGAPAQALNQPTAVDLASALDSLERGIESDGSVVAEQPSVWGQARLTLYRQEFETTMAAQLTNFQATLQGSLSRSDQAYAADALSLSYAAQAAASAPSSSPLCGGLFAAPASSSSSSSSASGATPTSTPAPATAAVPVSTSPFSYDPSTTAFGAFSNISRTGVATPIALPFVGPAGAAIGGVSLEPTVYLDQMKRYIDHLHELRRMNDGDDTADAPGYSLNLIRIPVSVLPGRRTQQRFGAEITFSIKPHLNEELLPMTFRNLVMNDLLDEVGVPLTHILNDLQWNLAMGELWHEIRDSPCAETTSRFEEFVQAVASMVETDPQKMEAAKSRYKRYRAGSNLRNLTVTAQKASLGVVSSSRLRTSREPFPQSQIVDIYGTHNWAEIVCTAWLTFGADVANKDVVHYPDVQGFLQQELDAAYNMMKLDTATQSLWPLCDYALVSDIHGRNVCDVANVRCNFERAADAIALRKNKDPELTAALAWAILVDSALLNQRLIEDMTDAPAARGGHFALPPRGTWLRYFMPEPEQPERDAFNEYVRCRWPIHVFSLDPEDDSQNIADSYSMRREMQLAMSLAFVSGNLSANNPVSICAAARN